MMEPVIGLEVHLQLQTRTKLFCSCKNEYGEPPNTNICPVCLGHPGTLPVLNWKAVELAVRMALALNCRINLFSLFERKNYFYPDLPKGYQISQYRYPLAEGGYVEIEVNGKKKKIRVKRLHIEEDAGKLIHTADGRTLVDFNRCGVPLVEIVSEPDMNSPEEAVAYLMAIKQIAQYTGVSDADMEKGNLRCDANISLRPEGSRELGVKTEVKNLNSFRFLQKALSYEIKRQMELIEKGEPIEMDTRTWDEKKGITISMRTKEEAHDYRYFPEPDLPPLELTEEFVEEIKLSLPELPAQKKERFVSQYGLDRNLASVLTAERELADYFERGASIYSNPRKLGNWIASELLRFSNELKKPAHELLPVERLVELLRAVDDGRVSGRAGKEVLEEMIRSGKGAEEVIREKGLEQISDEAQLREIIKQVLEQNPKQVEQYRKGKKGVIGFFVGQVMKATRGKANPQLVNKLIQEVLNEGAGE